MDKNKILIITNKDDPHTDGVINLAIQKNISQYFIRLNTEDFATNCNTNFDLENGFCIELLDSKKIINSKEIKTIWYRRPEDINVSHLPNKDVQEFVFQQCKSLLLGMYVYSESHSIWINPLFELRKASFKIPQLGLAKKIGFNVPNSIITNNPIKVVDFFNKYDKISTKSLDSPRFYYNGCNYPMYNRTIKDIAEIHNNLESIKLCPTYFQEYIEKEVDIRVIVMGKNIYSFSIASQSNSYSIEDFRGASADLLEHKAIKLPHKINEYILEYTRKENLLFSAIDLILAKDGKYYFLENNPNGQWMWLEYATKFPLTEKMIDFLLNPI